MKGCGWLGCNRRGRGVCVCGRGVIGDEGVWVGGVL